MDGALEPTPHNYQSLQVSRFCLQGSNSKAKIERNGSSCWFRINGNVFLLFGSSCCSTIHQDLVPQCQWIPGYDLWPWLEALPRGILLRATYLRTNLASLQYQWSEAQRGQLNWLLNYVIILITFIINVLRITYQFIPLIPSPSWRRHVPSYVGEQGLYPH